MKIIFSVFDEDDFHSDFGELGVGSCFIQANELNNNDTVLFMKLCKNYDIAASSNWITQYNTVNINTGYLCYFDTSDKIYVIDCYIQEK